MKHTSRTRADTAAIAKKFLDGIASGAKGKKSQTAIVAGLSGNLGAGKTAFVKATAKHLGIRQTVNSPTFVIIKKYPIKKKGTHKFLYHLDAYRLKNERELLILGWENIIRNADNLVLIEWPENVKQAMPKRHKKIKITHQKSGTRVIELR